MPRFKPPVIALLTITCFGFFKIQAQEQKVQLNKVKVVSPFAMVLGSYSAAYERLLGENHSLQFQGHFLNKNIGGEGKMSGFILTPSYRFYFNSTNPKFQAFAEAFARVASMTISVNVPDHSLEFLRGEWNSAGVGLCLGFQWHLSQQIFLEPFAGVAHYNTQYKLNNEASFEEDEKGIEPKILWPYFGSGMRMGLSLGFRF